MDNDLLSEFAAVVVVHAFASSTDFQQSLPVQLLRSKKILW